MRKLTPAWDSYRDDFFISSRVYIMTGSFHISLFEGTLHLEKIHVRFKIANIRMRYPFQFTLISHQNLWSFRIYMIPLRDFVPEWNSCPGTTTGVNSCWGDSRWHDILWWYHVNKCRAMRGNWSELTPERKSPQCHVNTPWGGQRKWPINRVSILSRSCYMNQKYIFHLNKIPLKQTEQKHHLMKDISNHHKSRHSPDYVHRPSRQNVRTFRRDKKNCLL